jgi:hypothetical protein
MGSMETGVRCVSGLRRQTLDPGDLVSHLRPAHVRRWACQQCLGRVHILYAHNGPCWRAQRFKDAVFHTLLLDWHPNFSRKGLYKAPWA